MRLTSATVLSLLALAGLASAQRPNDECTGAIRVNTGANGPFSNIGANTSLPAWPCGAGSNDVWFFWVATCTGIATFTTCGSQFDTVIQAFDTTVCNNDCAHDFAGGGPCNDDSCSSQSRVNIAVTNGALYYIRVGGFSGDAGTFPLNVSCTAGGFADDACTGATALSLGLNGPFHNVGYTTSIPPWACSLGGSDRWFSYVASATAPHTFDTCASNTSLDTTLEVFSGQCPCGLTSLGCNDDFCALASQVTVNLTQNQRYLIRVGGVSNLQGNFDVRVSIGTNSGAFNNQGGQCNGAAHTGITIAATGNPNLTGTVNISVSGHAGVPLIGLGIVPLSLPFFCCTIGHNYGLFLLAGTTLSLPVPLDPTLIGGNVYTQAIDVGGNGGCVTMPQLNLTDTIQITIG